MCAEEVGPVEVVFIVEMESIVGATSGIVSRAPSRIGENAVCKGGFLEEFFGLFLVVFWYFVCAGS